MKKLSFAIAAMLGLSVGAMAQTASHTVDIVIPEVTMIRILPLTGNTTTITYTQPTLAGDPISGPIITGSNLYLQYSSIMSTVPSSRKIYVSATGSNVTSGVTAKVVAGTAGANAIGGFGTSQGLQTILSAAGVLTTGTATKVIDGITSCYTNTGATDGSLLTYSSDVSSATSAQYAALRAQTTSLSVTYTLADN